MDNRLNLEDIATIANARAREFFKKVMESETAIMDAPMNDYLEMVKNQTERMGL